MLKQPTLSVAMTTHNGEKYLREQLESIARQTRLPDELVICDDGSTDQSAALIAAFAKLVTFPVRLHVNPVRLGVAGNFERVLSLCSGDLIALSDQDDVWLPGKLERCESALLADRSAGLVFSDAVVVDANLEPVGFTMWQALAFDLGRQRQVVRGDGIQVLLERNVVTGATVMFRRQFVNLVLPFGSHWVHDAWIAAIVAVYAGLALVQEPLILYRQHDDNVIGTSRLFQPPTENSSSALKTRTQPLINDFQRDTRTRYRELYEQLIENQTVIDAAQSLPDDEIAIPLRPPAADLLRHLHVRASLPPNRLRRLPAVVRELVRLRYHRFSRRRILPLGIAAALADLLSGEV